MRGIPDSEKFVQFLFSLVKIENINSCSGPQKLYNVLNLKDTLWNFRVYLHSQVVQTMGSTSIARIPCYRKTTLFSCRGWVMVYFIFFDITDFLRIQFIP